MNTKTNFLELEQSKGSPFTFDAVYSSPFAFGDTYSTPSAFAATLGHRSTEDGPIDRVSRVTGEPDW